MPSTKTLYRNSQLLDREGIGRKCKPQFALEQNRLCVLTTLTIPCIHGHLTDAFRRRR